jgi:DNA-binding transcriptional ArsR family regulator
MSVTNNDIQYAVTIFTALANEVRVKTLLTIYQSTRPLHIAAVAKELDIEYPALYRHVKLLEKRGLLVCYEVGRSQVLALRHGDLVQQLIETAYKLSET